MLDLDPAVQLEEEEVAAVEHELGRAGARVADRAPEPDRRVAHLGAQRGVQRRRRRLLEHLLVAPLDRALALAERDERAVLVAEQLDLHVSRPLDVPLREHPVVSERGRSLAPRGLERSGQLVPRAHDAHPAPAAARRRLEQQRKAELLRLARLDHRNTGLPRDPLRLELVSARAERLRRRSDPDEAGGADRFGEVAVLAEEAVARMNRVRARLLRGANVLLGVQVPGDLDDLVRAAGVQRSTIVRRDDGDGRDPELAARAEDAKRDLAAVRYKELGDLHSAASVSAHSAASTR